MMEEVGISVLSSGEPGLLFCWDEVMPWVVWRLPCTRRRIIRTIRQWECKYTLQNETKFT